MASISDLLGHIRSFVGIFHKTKTDKDNYWKTLINQKYINGEWYIQEPIHYFTRTTTPYECRITDYDFSGDNVTIKLAIKTNGQIYNNEGRIYIGDASRIQTAVTNNSQPNYCIFVGFQYNNGMKFDLSYRTTSTNNWKSYTLSNYNGEWINVTITINNGTFSFSLDGNSALSSYSVTNSSWFNNYWKSKSKSIALVQWNTNYTIFMKDFEVT